MMWFSSLLLVAAFSSVLGQMGSEMEQCVSALKELDLEDLEQQSGDKQMEVICPEILKAFRCLDDQLDSELGTSLEELADLLSDVEDVGNMLRVVVNTKNMLTDFCTDGTQLNEDVKADMQCFESIDEEEAANKCKERGAIYEIFTDMSNEIEEADSDFDPDVVCQETAFMAACVSYVVHETCGQRAFNTFNTILKRTTIFPNMICSAEKLEELKTTLIDKLDMSEAEKDLFKLGLDLKRRRK